MSLQDVTVDNLLYLLQKQYPSGVSTFSPCPVCATISRGGDYCAICLAEELVRRGRDQQRVNSLRMMLAARSEAQASISSLVEELRGDGK